METCITTLETNQYLESQAQTAFTEYEDVITAKQQRAAIDEVAALMMAGRVFRRYSAVVPGHFTEYSLSSSEYQCDDLYISIEHRIAAGTNHFDAISAIADLKALMLTYCRAEAAFYLGFEIDEVKL